MHPTLLVPAIPTDKNYPQDSEEIWLAAVKLESSNNEPERARMLLENARKNVSTRRIWKKSIVLAKQLGNAEEEAELLKESLLKFPDYHKLWILQVPQSQSQFSVYSHTQPRQDSKVPMNIANCHSINCLRRASWNCSKIVWKLPEKHTRQVQGTALQLHRCGSCTRNLRNTPRPY